jgi:hypothetical protein
VSGEGSHECDRFGFGHSSAVAALGHRGHHDAGRLRTSASARQEAQQFGASVIDPLVPAEWSLIQDNLVVGGDYDWSYARWYLTPDTSEAAFTLVSSRADAQDWHKGSCDSTYCRYDMPHGRELVVHAFPSSLQCDKVTGPCSENTHLARFQHVSPQLTLGSPKQQHCAAGATSGTSTRA